LYSSSVRRFIVQEPGYCRSQGFSISLWIGIRFVALVLPALLAIATHAQGGPPFITDDPGTPGNHHWKIHFG
jgi:hypothetical protein